MIQMTPKTDLSGRMNARVGWQTAYSALQNASGRVLVADDEAINRAILHKLFAPHYEVDEAADGYTGLGKILAGPGRYSAVLLDVQMPGMSGIQILQRLSERGLTASLPVFLITADQDTQLVREAYELGAMDILHKPVVPYVVLRRVQCVIELFSSRKYLSQVVHQQQKTLLAQTEEINRLNQGLLEAIATAIEFRGEEFGGHVQRICQVTRVLLKNTDFGAGMSPEEIERIALAAILHDVGKITIPDKVLLKQGRLTPEEHKVMEGHTVSGVRILQDIPRLHNSGIYEYACDIARHHHERWDGGGYPDGLAGDEITPWAQVVALADMYDALNCRRIYRPPFPHEKVLGTIQSGKGSAFDPRLVECFMSVEDQLYAMYEGLPELRTLSDAVLRL